MMGKTILKVITFAVTTEILYQICIYFRKKADIKNKPRFFEVMTFTEDSALCRAHYMNPTIKCAKSDCAVQYLRKFTDYLNSATKTLDICVYFFTAKPLAKAIINAHKRGVVVRIIMDETMTEHEGSQNKFFYEAGIQPKLKTLNGLMHNKYAIIDNSILITGSLNWTLSAFFGNFETALVTNESAIVEPFINGFEKIWIMLDSKTTTHC